MQQVGRLIEPGDAVDVDHRTEAWLPLVPDQCVGHAVDAAVGHAIDVQLGPHALAIKQLLPPAVGPGGRLARLELDAEGLDGGAVADAAGSVGAHVKNGGVVVEGPHVHLQVAAAVDAIGADAALKDAHPLGVKGGMELPTQLDAMIVAAVDEHVLDVIALAGLPGSDGAHVVAGLVQVVALAHNLKASNDGALGVAEVVGAPPGHVLEQVALGGVAAVAGMVAHAVPAGMVVHQRGAPALGGPAVEQEALRPFADHRPLGLDELRIDAVDAVRPHYVGPAAAAVGIVGDARPVVVRPHSIVVRRHRLADAQDLSAGADVLHVPHPCRPPALGLCVGHVHPDGGGVAPGDVQHDGLRSSHLGGQQQ